MVNQVKEICNFITSNGDIGVVSRGSRAAAVAVVTPCQMMVGSNPSRIKSKTASVPSINKVKMISDFISSNGML